MSGSRPQPPHARQHEGQGGPGQQGQQGPPPQQGQDQPTSAQPPQLGRIQTQQQTQTPVKPEGQPRSLLPALSPVTGTPTPRSAHPGQGPPSAGHGGPGGFAAQQQQQHTPTHSRQRSMQHPGGQTSQPPQRGGNQNVFQAVMGARPGQVPQDDVGGTGSVKIYASAYSQIPVFEAMIRNISVMRRMSDSWVNATQILKVAGISKSVRTKILEKQVQTQQHEKVQGGYGKYQGTWIPLDRGRALAEQYGVLQYLAPIFDFVPPPSGPPALPMRGGSSTPNAKTPARKSGPMSPFAHGNQPPPPPPPQFVQQQQQQQQPPPQMQEQMMGQGGPPPVLYPPPGHQQQQHMQGPPMFYQSRQPPPQQQQQPPPPHMHQGPPPMQQHHQPPHMHPGMGYPPDHPQRLEPSAPIDMGGPPSGLAPPATINGHGGPHGPMQGLPPPPTDVYVDQYGQAHAIAGSSNMPSPYENRPAKRQRLSNGESAPVADDAQESAPSAVDDDDDDLVNDRPPLPAHFRLSTKPFKPRLSSQSHRRRQQLLSLFQTETVDVRGVFELGDGEKPDWDVDMVIDEQGHTALHWACALARMSVIAQLIELGADIHRGNYSGETPLIRSVLTTNHAEAGTFSQLLEQHLGESIRTLDHSYASVIHHIALSAGLKGRAACARGYMACVLEWIAKEATKDKAAATPTAAAPSPAPPTEGLSLKRLVDLQDVRGDTALNVAARIGSKPLVNLLLDAGADKTRANKLGLRPVDFGVEIDALAVSAKEDTIASLKAEIKRPEKRSADVLKNISALFEDINRTFDKEMEKHVEALGAVEKSVRVATRSLAERRQQVEAARQRVWALEQQAERAENARRALEAQEAEWTGRTPLRTETALPPAFGLVPPGAPAPESESDTAPSAPPALDAPLPAEGEADALIKLRRIAAWEDRVARLLEERAAALEGDGADRAVKYRKVIALCAKVSVDQVDDMLDGLTTAIESDGPIDFTRLAGLVQRMRKAPVGPAA